MVIIDGYLGNVYLSVSDTALSHEAASRIQKAFQASSVDGILHLASVELAENLPANFVFLAHLCSLPNLNEKDSREHLALEPPTEELTSLLSTAPPLHGGEYLALELLETYWQDLLTLTLPHHMK